MYAHIYFCIAIGWNIILLSHWHHNHIAPALMENSFYHTSVSEKLTLLSFTPRAKRIIAVALQYDNNYSLLTIGNAIIFSAKGLICKRTGVSTV